MSGTSETERTSAPRQNLKRVRRHLTLLRELGNVALRSNSIEVLLQDVVERAAKGVDGDKAKILEYRSDTDDFLVRAGIGWKGGIVGHACLPSDMASPAHRAFRTGEPVHVADLRKEQQFRYSEFLREHEIVSLINLPIKDSEIAYGVLEIDRSEPRAYSEDDIGFLLGCADFLAAALQRHRAEVKRNNLFGDLHHRLKNNLQVVLSMVELERSTTEEPQLQKRLSRLSQRISAIAAAHRQFSNAGQAKSISIGAYLRTLCANLEQSIERGADTKQISLSVEDVLLTDDLALPLGLIVNELVANSLEHGLSEGSGTVSVVLRFDPQEGTAALSIADDGQGFPRSPREGLGLLLVRAFAQQIDAALIQETPPQGTATVVRFRWPWQQRA